MSIWYKRVSGTRSFRKIVVIATEGKETEPQYFRMFNTKTTTVHIRCVKHRTSAPDELVKAMKDYLRETELRGGYEAWIIVDRDSWTPAQLNRLYEWSQLNAKYGLAVSNPLFEYWLLLHFEDGEKVTSAHVCMERLKRYLPEYEKNNISESKMFPLIHGAMARAKSKDTPACGKWPNNTGTTVYKLVQNIMNSM